MKHFLVILISLFVLSLGVMLGVPPPPLCTTNADCDDGVFCNGWETCVEGFCVGAVSSCPPSVEVCVVRNAICDEVNDTCLDAPDDSLCPEGYICTLEDTCAADVGTALCREAQLGAQNAVVFGGPYKNHGQTVRTAANVVGGYEDAFMITEECSSCIMNQFARDFAIFDEKDNPLPLVQEPCGELDVCPLPIPEWFDPDGSGYRSLCLYDPAFVLFAVEDSTDQELLLADYPWGITNVPGSGIDYIALAPALATYCGTEESCDPWFTPLTANELGLCVADALDFLAYLAGEGVLIDNGCLAP